MVFEWVTVIVVLVIFGIFFYGAHRADKAVAEKAKVMREAQKKTVSVSKKG